MATTPYSPPSVGPTGLTVANYQSILADNLQAFLNIYGQNQFTGYSSAIYQLLSVLSLKQADQNLGLQLAYNQASPQTAVGAGLDRDLKMNGLSREPYSYSTAILTVSGVSGTPIVNGAAQDINGNIWLLPASLTIIGSSINVTATCTTPGNVSAEPNTINLISTPTSGWNSVNNAAAASPGKPVETDSEARARQAISVALPALTPLQATIAAILATSNVTRVAPGYPTPAGPGSSIENPTGATDSWGNPAHSISMVVEGGTDLAVATAIYNKKTIGCFTNGTTNVSVTDPNTGFSITISFYRPTYVPVYVNCVIHGYNGTPNSAVQNSVQSAIVAYLNELAIGETVPVSAVNYEAMNVNSSLPQPTFGVQTLTIGTATATTTASTTISTNTITVASATGIANNQLIVGAGIPNGALVTNVTGTTITMSKNATASATGVSTTFATVSAADLTMPNFFYVAQGVAANVLVSTT